MATLDELFAQHKAWIAACEDVNALLDRIAEWREDTRVGEARGDYLLQMRAGDLVELAQKRVVRLKAAAIQAEGRAARPTVAARTVPAVPPEPVRPMVRERAAQPVVVRQREAPERPRHEEAHRAREEEARAAATRLANAQAAKIEADAALARAQAAALVQANARSAATPTIAAVPAGGVPPQQAPASATLAAPPRQAMRPSPRAVATPAVRTPAPPTATPAVPPISHEDQLALMSVGRWPPSGPPPGHAFWARDQDWPAEWTLTGMDLARFRGRINVTQKVLAAQLGTETAVIADLERRPREKVGPAMQIALRKAMEVVGADERRQREAAAERAGRAAAPVPASAPATLAASAAPATPVGEPPRAAVAPESASADAAFTGRDLARLRAERRLSQRQLAELLGVGHGMVAKAEVAASEPLGERMRRAVAAMLAAGHGRSAG
jgi:DNA-binding transcriptional regulator YiaG